MWLRNYFFGNIKTLQSTVMCVAESTVYQYTFLHHSQIKWGGNASLLAPIYLCDNYAKCFCNCYKCEYCAQLVFGIDVIVNTLHYIYMLSITVSNVIILIKFHNIKYRIYSAVVSALFPIFLLLKGSIGVNFVNTIVYSLDSWWAKFVNHFITFYSKCLFY